MNWFSNGNVAAELQSNDDPLLLVHQQVRPRELSVVSLMNKPSGR